MHIMDVFLWRRCLTEDEIASLPTAMGAADYNAVDLLDDNWHWGDSPSRVWQIVHQNCFMQVFLEFILIVMVLMLCQCTSLHV